MLTVSILSREEDYRSFLTWECADWGFSVCEYNDKLSPRVVLVDLDAIPAFSLPKHAVIIGYTRYEGPSKKEGVDHLLHRPFLMEALHELLKAIASKHHNALSLPRTHSQGNTVELGEQSVHIQGQDVFLSANEYAVFAYLFERKGQPVTRAELSALIGNKDSNMVDVYVSYLRKKLEYPHGIKLIHTVRKIGYTIKT